MEVFEEAGLEAGVHFVVIQCPEDIEDVDCNSCYTLITVPKAGEDYDISAGYQAIDSFVYSGGNFLAQDSGISSSFFFCLQKEESQDILTYIHTT